MTGLWRTASTSKGQSQEVDLDRPDVDWPRLVIACRKRIGVMINQLKDKLGEPIPGPERARWLFNRILLVLCLLQRLRTLPPASSAALDGRRRPASLVGVNQLREAFKVAMQGMYGGVGIARLLEASPNHRASDDRAMLDDVLLWTAHEIGADYEEKRVFNEQPVNKARRLGDRADVVVVATSAAANPLAQEVGELRALFVEDLGRCEHAFHGLVPTPPSTWRCSPIRSGRETASHLEAQTEGRRVRVLGC